MDYGEFIDHINLDDINRGQVYSKWVEDPSKKN